MEFSPIFKGKQYGSLLYGDLFKEELKAVNGLTFCQAVFFILTATKVIYNVSISIISGINELNSGLKNYQFELARLELQNCNSVRE